MTVTRSACPLNCPDSCGFLVEKTSNGLKVKGNKEHPITKGFVCGNGQAQADRTFASDRLRFPILRQGEGWQRISWEEAYSLMVEKIQQTLSKTGSWGIYHHYDWGANGVLRSLDRRFFQALGGVTEPRGSMCWGAGYRAQEIDFGGVYASDWEDLAKAKTIILWGRDPAVTNRHLLPHLREARKNGTKIIVVNPVKVKSVDFADEYVRVNPGTDAALALGISYFILSERWLDLDFVRKYVHGFDEYAFRVKQYPPERVTELTGVRADQLRELARQITHARPVSILLGYGMQRYAGGGNTVRAIDALAAISGNVGHSGAGVHYAHQYHRGNLNSVLLPAERYRSRSIPHALVAEGILQADPPVELAFVTRSNPLIQEPDSLLWREAWHKIPFKVVFDTVLTETARQSDLVLPVTTIFEETDLIVTSWSPMLQYAHQASEPQGEAKPEPAIFTELARRLGMEKDFPYTSEEWLEYVSLPLAKYGLNLDTLREGPVRAPYIPKVAWENKEFLTPSGKIELSSELAKEELGEAVVSFLPSDNRHDLNNFPWHLLTPHPAQGLHSQFQEEEGFVAFIHPDLAEKARLASGDWAIVETVVGQLVTQVRVSEDIHPRTVVIPEGRTVEGSGVNRLTRGILSECGETTAYYEVYCHIRKWYVD